MDDMPGDELARWLRPSEALRAVPAHVAEGARRGWVLLRLRTGVIVAREGNGAAIPQESWTWREVGTDVWMSGDLRVTNEPENWPSVRSGPEVFDGSRWVSYDAEEPISRITTTVTYFDVRLDPKMFEVGEALRVRGGRPSARWWDDLWIELCRQLYVGDLKPDTQAAVERAMHDWLSASGHEAGDTTIRSRARRLFHALGTENGNAEN